MPKGWTLFSLVLEHQILHGCLPFVDAQDTITISPMRHDDEHERVIRAVVYSSKFLRHFFQLVTGQIPSDDNFKGKNLEEMFKVLLVFSGSWSIQILVFEV